MKREDFFVDDQHHNEEYSINFEGIIFRKTVLSISWAARIKDYLSGCLKKYLS